MARSRRAMPAFLLLALVPLAACTGRSLRTPWDDALITGAVKVRLMREYGPALTDIDVDTTDRTVVLRGRVPSEVVRQRAAVVALALPPVRAVINELTVETEQGRRPPQVPGSLSGSSTATSPTSPAGPCRPKPKCQPGLRG